MRQSVRHLVVVTCTESTGAQGAAFLLIIMGHEAAGVIAQIGAAVSEWKIGDPVIFDITLLGAEGLRL
jgi:D-arabinose 1-dehydrogenase-like Zn-dependent alcohol dehydrogenase